MFIENYFGIQPETVRQMVDATKSMANAKSGDNGFQNTKVFLFDEYAVLKMQNIDYRNVTTLDADLKYLERLTGTLLALYAEGVNVVPIFAFQSDGGDGYIIQKRAKGAELYEREKMNDKDYVLDRVGLLSEAPQVHFDKFIADIVQITDAGVLIDFIGKDNFFYHETIGFQFIDLNAHYDYIYGLANEKPQSEQIAAYGGFSPCYYDTVPKYRDTVSKLLPELTEKEHAALRERNKKIFEKCKTAMVNNKIAQETIDAVIADERIISQKRQLNLI